MGSIDQLNTLATQIQKTIDNFANTVMRMHNQNPANTNLQKAGEELNVAQENLRNALFGHNKNTQLENTTNNNSMRR
jgi:hypothetical protein